MQTASSSFTSAVETHRTWTPPRLRADWRLDGYDGDGTIDDLSGQVSASWEVAHTLDDGYPTIVSFVSGTSVPELRTDLAGRNVAGAPMTAAAYWSPMRSDSPVYGLDRDVAPLTLDVGLVTANGPEYVRVFTGQMANTPVKSGAVRLESVSATRLALMRPVQPPAFNYTGGKGIRASWLASWCLFQCGIYAGPRIREGSTVWYSPNHGSLWRFLDGNFPNGNSVDTFTIDTWNAIEVDPTGALTFAYEVDWVPGPYVAAPALQLKTALSRRAYQAELPFGDTAQPGTSDVLSQANARARMELWIRGDAADVNTAPGGSGGVSRLMGFQLTTSAAGNPYAQLGVGTDRKVYVTVYDGTNTRTLKSTGTLPTDGAWYFVGAAYDLAVDKLWVNLGGTVESSSPGTMNQSALPARDSWNNDGSPFLLSYLPFAEVTLATGAEANVDSYPLWRNDTSFAPTATVGLSHNKLVAVAEPAPREAWQIIADCAQSEIAAMRCTETDLFEYLPLGHWVKDAQQVVQDLYSTDLNAGDFSIDQDPTKIRNTIGVSYNRAALPTYDPDGGTLRRVFELATDALVAVPPGTSTLTVTMTALATTVGPVVEVVDNVLAPGMSRGNPYATLCDAVDGSGTYATGSQVSIAVTAWTSGQATLQLVNTTSTTYYLTNDANVTALALVGIPVLTTQAYISDADATSVAIRGPRLLDVSPPMVQSEESARRLARNLKMAMRYPVITVGDETEGVPVTADPRRQPGDLGEFRDSVTGVQDGLWRLQGVKHAVKDASYTQQVVARRTLPICIVGEGVVGESLIGPAT
jgi:hypothetical protein